MQLGSAQGSPGQDPKTLQHATLWPRDRALDKKSLGTKKPKKKKLP